jgi:hypothetical protein
MAKKQFWPGMLAMALVFTLMMTGRGDGGEGGNIPGGGKEEGIYIGLTFTRLDITLWRYYTVSDT